MLQTDAAELKEWTQLKVVRYDMVGGLDGTVDGSKISRLWAAPKAWAFELWTDE